MEMARVQLENLKSEVKFERKLRKRAESLSQALAQELSIEREAREATEKVCEDLLQTLVRERNKMHKAIEELEEERKMMRVSETMREERVRMKLSEAKIVMEVKLREMEEAIQLRDEMGVNIDSLAIYGEVNFGNEDEYHPEKKVFPCRNSRDRKLFVAKKDCMI